MSVPKTKAVAPLLFLLVCAGAQAGTPHCIVTSWEATIDEAYSNARSVFVGRVSATESSVHEGQPAWFLWLRDHGQSDREIHRTARDHVDCLATIDVDRVLKGLERATLLVAFDVDCGSVPVGSTYVVFAYPPVLRWFMEPCGDYRADEVAYACSWTHNLSEHEMCGMEIMEWLEGL